MNYPSPLANEMLAGLPAAEANLAMMHVRRVRLASGQVPSEPGQAVEQVYFVEHGVASLVVETQGKRGGVEVATIGREGLVGFDALLGAILSASAAAVVQIPGQAMRMARRDLRRLCTACPDFRRRCMNVVSSLLKQVMETSASNARNSLAERCAPWLLMAQERVEEGDVYITHEALSDVLGVRRSGVSVVLAGLQEAGIIAVHPGRIAVRDPGGLMRVLTGVDGETGEQIAGKRAGTRRYIDAQAMQRAERSHATDAGRIS